MKNVSDKRCRRNQNTDICRTTFSENLAVNVRMWKNIVVPDRPHMWIWHMRIASWVPKDKNTLRICHTCCLPLQQWLHERTPILRHTLTAVLLRSDLLSVASVCGNSVYWRNNTSILKVEEMCSRYSYIPPKHLWNLTRLHGVINIILEVKWTDKDRIYYYGKMNCLTYLFRYIFVESLWVVIQGIFICVH